MAAADIERPDAFYLGRTYDLSSGKVGPDPVLYDSADLTTHAVCVGMTGSGKTGLCICLLEEAILDGIPAILIDPKGDLGNLLLTFPGLTAEEFAPWVDPDTARREGAGEAEYAAAQAEAWRKGLADWQQDGERIRQLREAADVRIYTPGSSAGLPVSILSSLAAPPAELLQDEDLLRDRVQVTATSLLSLLGIDADPVQSREHILLATLFDQTWRAGRDLDLAGLIHGVQKPPFDRVGVMELETFYPEKERFKLATAINSLVAAPGFAAWLEGTPLDVQKLLYTADGKPRVAIFSIAHLAETERMFFVSLLLNQTLGWMRAQPGTENLRAILYMDEVFGFLPPSAEPPSKRPFLTLLKQARAHGLGLVLATQNPVDLDYKALSNAGTWFLGRLQTERDKMRVLDGLEGVSAGEARFDRKAMEETLAGLGKRVFLMHNVHEGEPVIFHTRWAMSYLRGPLTRRQIEKLMAGHQEPEPTADAAATASDVAAGTAPVAPAAAAPAGGAGADATAASAETSTGTLPVLPPDVRQVFLPPLRQDTRRHYPGLLALVRMYFADRGREHEGSQEFALFAPFDDGPVPIDWTAAEEVEVGEEGLGAEPALALPFAPLPAAASRKASYGQWEKALTSWLYNERRLELLRAPGVGLTSEAGESREAFLERVREAVKAQRGPKETALDEKLRSDLARLDERIQKATANLAKQEEQVAHQKRNAWIHLGTTVLGGVLGRRRSSGLGSAARSYSRVGAEKQDVERAQGELAALERQREEREHEHEEALRELDRAIDAAGQELETVALAPRKADIRVRLLTLAWRPE
ncbi:MAG: ATP-binding protein [Thermoanaerobaculia bacterium]